MVNKSNNCCYRMSIITECVHEVYNKFTISVYDHIQTLTSLRPFLHGPSLFPFNYSLINKKEEQIEINKFKQIIDLISIQSKVLYRKSNVNVSCNFWITPVHLYECFSGRIGASGWGITN